MRINGSLTNAVSLNPQPDPRANARRRGDGDFAQISDTAKHFLSAGQAKLAQLQAAHAAGTYQVSPSQIARSIINAHLKV